MKAADEVTTRGAAAHFREAGAGPPVICLHSSASSSGQWRALTDRLADRFRVVAVDLYGYGRSLAWPGERPMYLDDQVALLEPILRAAEEPFHLVVGHRLRRRRSASSGRRSGTPCAPGAG